MENNQNGVGESPEKKRLREARTAIVLKCNRASKPASILSMIEDVKIVELALGKTDYLRKLPWIIEYAISNSYNEDMNAPRNFTQENSPLWSGAVIGKVTLLLNHVDGLVSKFFEDYKQNIATYRFIALFIVGYMLRDVKGTTVYVTMSYGRLKSRPEDENKNDVAELPKQSTINPDELSEEERRMKYGVLAIQERYGVKQILHVDSDFNISCFDRSEYYMNNSKCYIQKRWYYNDEFKLSLFFLHVMKGRIDLTKFLKKDMDTILQSIPEGRWVSEHFMRKNQQATQTSLNEQKVQWMMNNHK